MSEHAADYSIIHTLRPVHLAAVFPGMKVGHASAHVRGKISFPKYLQPILLEAILKAKESGLFARVDLEHPPRASFVRGEGGVRAKRKAAIEARRKAKKALKA